ncbi:alpha/beta fold hydrolase [Bradyrhizobium sp. CSA112]|uniref:alpha/beta fold hydrolase n=1 Tax=Bradyrhizobium sp. CSA112 TaxID=2699170 RepID=UPI0023AF2355|nr:alpha/beta hydrolase [Bradyrhizobium sp. CSA112]MDE5452044.1 alpha/beta fold hydrolase [Bradyrhizobium sp. CSA112]
MFEGFTSLEIETGATQIFARRAGSGPPVLLLHGFPETHAMWREIAPRLAATNTVVCADLRGYGRSGCPASTADHAPYSKRAFAADMLALMDRLGFASFAVVGHDRGGRVAQRMALDATGKVDALAVLDVIPVSEVWDHADDRLALAFWPWSLLAQPSPLPETILIRCGEALVVDAAANWGSGNAFAADVQREYADMLHDAAHAHAICEEYRAAASIDRDHDRLDQEAGRKIACPTLALWSAAGPLSKWYESEGGPLAIWRRWSADVRGRPVEGGHFFPEERPKETAEALSTFLRKPNG